MGDFRIKMSHTSGALQDMPIDYPTKFEHSAVKKTPYPGQKTISHFRVTGQKKNFLKTLIYPYILKSPIFLLIF